MKNYNNILSRLDFSVSAEEMRVMQRKTQEIVGEIKEKLKKLRIMGDVFVGGSFAKDTMTSGKEYDVDIFVRFDLKYEKALSDNLEKLIKKLKMKYERIHGSRDYYRINEKNLTFEIIPVLDIKKPREAKNVTDLSYFHVKYIKNKINEKLAREIRLMKIFCKAQGVYGAESYIQGLSGYAIECLVIHYGSFMNLARKIVDEKEKIIIDDGKQYKNERYILIELNESKLKSPIVLVDPTYKERNVLAALSDETFKILQNSLKNFLRNPSKKYFEKEELNEEKWISKAKSENAVFRKIELETNRQAGDIAGSKLRKFSNFLIGEISEYFEIMESNFVYNLDEKAYLYLIVEKRKEIVKRGPPMIMKKEVGRFKKINKKTFVKKGIIYSRQKILFSFDAYIKSLRKKDEDKIRGMSITGIRIC